MRGGCVFVSGDAGIGKSALVRAFCSHSGAGARVLVGACDGLRTPRPLGPLADIGRVVGGRLGDATAMADPVQRVVVALLDELRSGPPTVVVIEDVHWADEATLDVLGMLGRRAQQLGALAIVTYRADELPPAHPLRIVLGDLATAAGVLRIELPPLSVDAVPTLAAPHGVDAVDLHAKTAGNPFFVTEVLAGGGRTSRTRSGTPCSRERRGSAGGHAHSSRRSQSSLSRRSCGSTRRSPRGRWDDLDECLASGMLRSERHAIAFGMSSRG